MASRINFLIGSRFAENSLGNERLCHHPVKFVLGSVRAFEFNDGRRERDSSDDWRRGWRGSDQANSFLQLRNFRSSKMYLLSLGLDYGLRMQYSLR